MARTGQRKPTSFDVAKLAGVSRSAVSRAFTPGANIAPETKDRVTQAAATLGYRVNSLARGLQQDHSGIVGLVASRLDTPLRSRQVRYLSEGLIREGYKPMLITVETPDHITELVDSLLSYNVAGMIFTSDSPPRALIEECGRMGLPVVLVNRAGVSNWGDRVVADNAAAGTLATETLVELGATNLGCLVPRKETYSVSGRSKEFLKAAERMGVPTEVLHAEDQGYDLARAGVCATDLAALDRIDGLFCATDLMAIGALDALRHDLGIAVPDRIQVLGFDDIEQAAWASYDLSTIRQDVAAQSNTVLRLLIERMEDNTLDKRVENEPLTVILRGTTRQKAVNGH